jgi:transcription initiation factor TFIIIB Brf1 subunit/transcription initiation factor TFIIB
MRKKCIPYGSDVSDGKFECADCGKIITMASKTSLPPCPNYNNSEHSKKCWNVLSGQGDSPNDPYPN